MDWRIKGAIQKLLGCVPGGRHLHFALQARFGGLARFDDECDSKVVDWQIMVGHLRAAAMPVRGATLLEIGTGWYPTLPVCLYLAGAARVFTLDLERHLAPELTTRLVRRLARHVDAVARAADADAEEVGANHAALLDALRGGASLEDATHGVLQYRAPADATATGLPDACVDVVFSNSVLEHVLGTVIEACFAEAMRILRPGGIVFHSANCGDHYAYVDPSIHQLNYLGYSEARWRRWNNAFLHQNRLRAVDFTRMATRAGFTIEIDTSRAKPERLAQVESMKVDPGFAGYTREQLAITSIDFVGRKPR